MRKTGNVQKATDLIAVNPALVAVNAAVVAFVDELLRLPSAAAAATVVDLLYGRDREALPAVLSHVNGGIHIPLSDLLASRSPLAVVLPERLRVSAGWRADGMKGARAAARARYRELQAAFVTSVRRAASEPTAALLRYTYGSEGRHWLWTEAAARVLHRVAGLNRAVLDLLAAIARGEVSAEAVGIDAVAAKDFDLPDEVRELMAAALPAVAVPDWTRFAAALEGSDAVLSGDESVVRYQSLLAEILGLRDERTMAPA